VTGEMDPQRKVTAEWHEPPDTIPTAQSGWHEPALPGANDQPKAASSTDAKKSSARSRGQKKKTDAVSSSNGPAQQGAQTGSTNTSKVARQ
jgi:hypothetical protein